MKYIDYGVRDEAEALMERIYEGTPAPGQYIFNIDTCAYTFNVADIGKNLRCAYAKDEE